MLNLLCKTNTFHRKYEFCQTKLIYFKICFRWTRSGGPLSAGPLSAGGAGTADTPPLLIGISMGHKKTSSGQKGRLQPDHEKKVLGDHCFVKVPVNYYNCCGEGIEVYRNGSKVWKWLWNFRVLSIPDFLKKLKMKIFFGKFEKIEKSKRKSRKALLPFEFSRGNQVDGSPRVAVGS